MARTGFQMSAQTREDFSGKYFGGKLRRAPSDRGLRVEIIAMGGHMRLGDVKNVIS